MIKLQSREDTYSFTSGNFKCGCLNCIHCIGDFATPGFVISAFCSTHFAVTLAGMSNVDCYTGDFVIKGDVIAGFSVSCLGNLPRTTDLPTHIVLWLNGGANCTFTWRKPTGADQFFPFWTNEKQLTTWGLQASPL